MTTDSDRFQAWLQDAFDARQADTETISMAPFRAVVTPAGVGKSAAWVTLVDAGVDDAEAQRSLASLRAAFAGKEMELEVEYDDKVFPNAGTWLDEAGFTFVERNPLMAVRPETFKPFAAPDVALTRLSQHGKPAELDAFQKIRWTDGGDVERAPQAVELLRNDLMTPTSVYMLAWLDWEAVGTGVSHLTRDTAEIVGVVTRNDHRRRGVAATVTSELVRQHFERGGDFVFLDAANEIAARVYDRLGFTRFGSKVLYK